MSEFSLEYLGRFFEPNHCPTNKSQQNEHKGKNDEKPLKQTKNGGGV